LPSETQDKYYRLSEALQSLPRAHGQDLCRALFKQAPEDFQVFEELGFECDGAGEHLWLQVRKTGLTTLDVARRLSHWSGVPVRMISYSGLKDKQGICTQWFSIHDRTLSPDLLMANADPNIKTLQAIRNSRKLRRGVHAGNHFVIRLHDPTADGGNSVVSALTLKTAEIRAKGVPNYFGEQRFGRNNIARALAMFTDRSTKVSRTERSFLLSAARSAIFNMVLAERVKLGNWDTFLRGDVFNLEGSSSVFVSGCADQALYDRLSAMDIHPTGPLWGGGALMSSDECAALELRIGQLWPEFAAGLIAAGLLQQRRSLRLAVKQLNYRFVEDGAVELSFTLPAGTYATSVLHELFDYQSEKSLDKPGYP
jgi:tRNA pseudouridine13 synthase